jgi:hypothetical protein
MVHPRRPVTLVAACCVALAGAACDESPRAAATPPPMPTPVQTSTVSEYRAALASHHAAVMTDLSNASFALQHVDDASSMRDALTHASQSIRASSSVGSSAAAE